MSIVIPPLGSRVLIATRYTLPWMNSHKPAIEGTIAHGNTWDKPNTIRLTGVNNCLGEAVIAMERVSGVLVLQEPQAPSENVAGASEGSTDLQEFEIKGSKGDLYRVQLRGDQSSCSCPAGSNGRMCKHVKAARERRQAGS